MSNSNAVGTNWWSPFSLTNLRSFRETFDLLSCPVPETKINKKKQTNSTKILDSFPKNSLLEFCSEALIVSIWTYSWNDNKVHYQYMISTKIVIQIVAKNHEKNYLCPPVKLKWWKMFPEILETSELCIINVSLFKIPNPDSVRVQSFESK